MFFDELTKDLAGFLSLTGALEVRPERKQESRVAFMGRAGRLKIRERRLAVPHSELSAAQQLAGAKIRRVVLDRPPQRSYSLRHALGPESCQAQVVIDVRQIRFERRHALELGDGFFKAPILSGYQS